MSVYGSGGATAYFGMMEVGRPKPGETVVVSAAAGATGSIAGQIAKIAGARVVGIAGGPEKCRVVVEDFGFDACIDYKNENVAAALKAHCPKGVNVYYDNVGGDILNAVLGRLAPKARVVLCGVISSYLTGEHPGPSNYVNLLAKTASMQGFNALEMWDRFERGIHRPAPVGAGRQAGASRNGADRTRVLRRCAQRALHRGQHRQDAGSDQPTQPTLTMRIGIVGAGIAGLACAHRLAGRGHDVVLFDKGRGPGGRMSTRRVQTPGGEAHFDHGAQYFTVRDDDFAQQVSAWIDDGVVAPWPAAGSGAYVGVPAMNSPVRRAGRGPGGAVVGTRHRVGPARRRMAPEP